MILVTAISKNVSIETLMKYVTENKMHPKMTKYTHHLLLDK
jgi:hypothetical protein